MKKVLEVKLEYNLCKKTENILSKFWKQGKKLTPKQKNQLSINGIYYREALYLKDIQSILVVMDDNREVVFEGVELKA